MLAAPCVEIGVVAFEIAGKELSKPLPPGLLKRPPGCTGTVPTLPGLVRRLPSSEDPRVQCMQQHSAKKCPPVPCKPHRNHNFKQHTQQSFGETPLPSASTRVLRDHDITTAEPPWTAVTTVIMRNLPNRYDRTHLLNELAESGFNLSTDFDFFYLPMDHSHSANLGYCFINFVQTSIANVFAERFAGAKLNKFRSSEKTVSVMPASIQGYDRNFKYYSSTKVMARKDPQQRPVFARVATDLHSTQTSGPSSSDCSNPNTAPSSTQNGGCTTGRNSSHGESSASSTETSGARSKPNTAPSSTQHGGCVAGRNSSHGESSASSTETSGLQRTPGRPCSLRGRESPRGLDDPQMQPVKIDVKRSCPSCGAEWGSQCRFCVSCGSKLLPVTSGITALQPPPCPSSHRPPVSVAPVLFPGSAGDALDFGDCAQSGMPLTTEFLAAVPRAQQSRGNPRLAEDTSSLQWHGHQQQQQLARALGEWGFEAPERSEVQAVSDRMGRTNWAQRYQHEVSELKHRLAVLEASQAHGIMGRFSV